jgi:hypothetical protein
MDKVNKSLSTFVASRLERRKEKRHSRSPFARAYALTHLADQNHALQGFEKCQLVLAKGSREGMALRQASLNNQLNFR